MLQGIKSSFFTMNIGYIYKYSESEKQGILAYGHTYGPKWTKPILFTEANCKSRVSSGQLVYFDLINENEANNIERASLINFRRYLVDSIASCYNDNNKRNDWYSITHILFEDISKIKDSEDSHDIFVDEDMYWDLIDDFFDEDEISDITECSGQKDDKPIPLHGDITSLFSLFGAHTHPNMRPASFRLLRPGRIIRNYSGKDTIAIDLLDINYWVDKEMVKKKTFYCDSYKRVLELFNLFELKRKIAFQDNLDSSKLDKGISEGWKLILQRFTNEDLSKIIKQQQLLQPALPRRFCIQNMDALSIDFGFPLISLCEAFLRYKIENLDNSRDYNLLSDTIYDALYLKKPNRANEGIKADRINKKNLRKLKKYLDDTYKRRVLKILREKLKMFSGSMNVEQVFSTLELSSSLSYLISFEVFIDRFVSSIDSITQIDCKEDIYGNLISAYNCLTETDKAFFHNCVKKKSEEILIAIAKSSIDNKVFELSSALYQLKGFYNESIIESIKKIVNTEFSALENVNELREAFDLNFIEESLFVDRYILLTKDYNYKDFIRDLIHCFYGKLPKGIQEYIIRRIYQEANYNSLSEKHCFRMESPYNDIWDLEDLLKWFKYSISGFDDDILESVLCDLTSNLSKEERWKLFEQGYISSPSMDNIREHLDIAYLNAQKQRKAQMESIFKKECFQNVMVADFLGDDSADLERSFIIYVNLSFLKTNKLINDGNEKALFLNWVRYPHKNIDWKLTSQYFHLLPKKQQIRIFKYIIYLYTKENERFTLTELTSKLTNNGEYELYMPLQILLFLLQKKLHDLKNAISYDEMRSICKVDTILNDFTSRSSNNAEVNVRPSQHLKSAIKALFDEIKDLFIVCRGHQLFSWREFDSEYFFYYGEVHKKQTSNDTFYVISLYERAKNRYGQYHNYYDGGEVIHRIKKLIEKNFSYKIIDDEYWISSDYLIDIKEFVIKYNIKDECDLFDEEGLTPPPHTNNLYTFSYEYDYTLCKCSKKCRDVDPKWKFPFYWCNKQPCARRGGFLEPLEDWKNYRFVDILYILYGCDDKLIDTIWEVNAEISQFINRFIANPEEIVEYAQIDYNKELGNWKDSMEIISTDNDDEYYDEEYEDDSYYNRSDYENRPTYGRYSGSYAQDEMGYSDDDIDTIFDGDPDAYWNID